MTEPIDQATKTLIDEEADKYGFRVPYDGSNEFYDKSAVAGYIAGATVWAERLKQERNKAIDECIVIIRNAVKTGFPHYHIASVLQTLKRKDNEPEFTHPDETED